MFCLTRPHQSRYADDERGEAFEKPPDILRQCHEGLPTIMGGVDPYSVGAAGKPSFDPKLFGARHVHEIQSDREAARKAQIQTPKPRKTRVVKAFSSLPIPKTRRWKQLPAAPIHRDVYRLLRIMSAEQEVSIGGLVVQLIETHPRIQERIIKS